MQVVNACVEVRVHLHAVAVKLQLRRIEQRLHGGKARDDVIDRLNEVDDVHHSAVRHGRGDVARHRVRQRGAQVRARKLFLPRALAVQNIAVALHQNVSRAQHVRQLAHLLRVFDRLIERLVEVVGA